MPLSENPKEKLEKKLKRFNVECFFLNFAHNDAIQLFSRQLEHCFYGLHLNYKGVAKYQCPEATINIFKQLPSQNRTLFK